MKTLQGFLIVAVAALVLSGCAGMNDFFTPKTKTGAGIGAVGGGILGALVDSGQPWRGAIIGAAAGAAAGGWIGHTMDKDATGTPVVSSNTDIVNQAARDAATQNVTVKYSRTTENGVKEEVVATPQSTRGSIRVVNIKYYRDSTLISSETREVSI